MSHHGYRVGECRGCGRAFKRVRKDGGRCWVCRGWSVCQLCGEAKPADAFSCYRKAGRQHIASRCRECLARGVSRFESREEVFFAYGLTSGDAIVVLKALPAMRQTRVRIARQVPAQDRPKRHPHPAADQFDLYATSEAKWRDLASAAIEILKLEPEGS